MGQKTSIEWTDASWNPIRGCSRVSEGCRNCYAERTAARFSGAGQPYEDLAKIVNIPRKNGSTATTEARWTGVLKFIPERLEDPLHWKQPRRIFVNSMSDLFHEGVPNKWINLIFGVMAQCPQHTFQILTKRPERMKKWAAYVEDFAFPHGIETYDPKLVNWPNKTTIVESTASLYRGYPYVSSWPLPNVWLGVSVEDQATADARIPLLLETPAAVRFISAEPLLGSIDLRNLRKNEHGEGWLDSLTGASCGYDQSFIETNLDWVICGGESGGHARAMHPDWPRSVRDQCRAAGIPFFFKQWGEWAPTSAVEIAKCGDRQTFRRKQFTAKDPATGAENVSAEVFSYGKKIAGRELDGRVWDEYPQ